MSNLDTLRREVEDLATRLVVAPPGSEGAPGADAGAVEWIASLRRISESARREGIEHAAAIASNAIESLSAGPGSGARLEPLQSAILSLQQVLNAAENPPASSSASLAQDRELLGDFVLESREHLANIEAQALKLERDCADREALNAAFRAFHTIKGLAGFLELWEIQKLAHEVEAVLDRARNSELAMTPAAVEVILQSADHLGLWLAHLEKRLENQDSDPPAHSQSLYDHIVGLLRDEGSLPFDTPDGKAVPETPATPRLQAQVPLAEGHITNTVVKPRCEAMAVKVDTAKLDYLVDMAGEMVIAESLVRHDPELGGARNPRLQRNLAQLTRITAELQKTAMALRLIPIGPLFRRMARLVRDLARQFGKRVEMVTEGDEIQLDRTIVEELADPLMHMVRNAIDHGIEGPDERLRRGKNDRACLTLKAQHRAGQVVVEITDDGRGLDRRKIVATAIERGLVPSAEGLSESDIDNLIFEPGFSTAAQVTNVSGRGVGMDVVRRHIEKLRGRIEIHSEPGAGTTFSLKLPLTLAIIDGLVVAVGSERYIVPMFAVREMFRPKPETLWTVEQRGEMALVRGSLLPVLRLYRKFAVTPKCDDPLQSVLIVGEVEGRRFGLLVDDLIGKQEVVIKGLGKLFKNVSGISGGAILGDGRVGLILDMDRIYRDWVGDANR
jgi:two-component system, chemotaxis family, sensor kinase CheA